MSIYYKDVDKACGVGSYCIFIQYLRLYLIVNIRTGNVTFDYQSNKTQTIMNRYLALEFVLATEIAA